MEVGAVVVVGRLVAIGRGCSCCWSIFGIKGAAVVVGVTSGSRGCGCCIEYFWQ